MIDVIIPAYNAHDTIEETLCSIAYQDFSDNINVYIVNDCSHSGYSKFVDFYSKFINICELVLDKNSGPGTARQFGIDNSNSEYIVFIDSDDVFSDCYALQNLYNEINNNNCDVVVSTFIEETCGGFSLKENDLTWLHGKIYRRAYIVKNNIRFNETRINEDTGFNQSLFLSNCKMKYYNKKTYIWRNNSNSITRKDFSKFFINGTYEYAINSIYALKNAIRLNGDNVKIGRFAYSSLVYIYCCYLLYYKKKYDADSLKLFKEAKKILEIYFQYPVNDKIRQDVLHNQFKINYDVNKGCFLNPKCTMAEFISILDEV